MSSVSYVLRISATCLLSAFTETPSQELVSQNAVTLPPLDSKAGPYRLLRGLLGCRIRVLQGCWAQEARTGFGV